MFQQRLNEYDDDDDDGGIGVESFDINKVTKKKPKQFLLMMAGSKFGSVGVIGINCTKLITNKTLIILLHSSIFIAPPR